MRARVYVCVHPASVCPRQSPLFADGFYCLLPENIYDFRLRRSHTILLQRMDSLDTDNCIMISSLQLSQKYATRINSPLNSYYISPQSWIGLCLPIPIKFDKSNKQWSSNGQRRDKKSKRWNSEFHVWFKFPMQIELVLIFQNSTAQWLRHESMTYNIRWDSSYIRLLLSTGAKVCRTFSPQISIEHHNG